MFRPMPKVLGGVLLLLAITILVANIYHGSTTDEGDALATARQMLDGQILYKDLFHHHFPLSFDLITLAFRAWGISVVAARISTVLFWLSAYLATWRISGLRVWVGIVALVACLSAFAYASNTALYHSLNGVAILPLVAFTLRQFTDATTTPIDATLAGAFAATAVLLNPLLASIIGLCFLVITTRRTAWRLLSVSVIACATLVLLYGVYLWMQGALLPFYQQAIVFNREVYTLYNGFQNRSWLQLIGQQMLSGMDLIPVSSELTPYPNDFFANYSPLLIWLMSGYAYRVLIVVATLSALRARQWPLATFIYMLGIFSALRGKSYFDQTVLVQVGLACAAFVIHQIPTRGLLSKTFVVIMCGIGIIVAGASAHYRITQPERFTYAVSFDAHEARGEDIRRLACGARAELGIYPGDPYALFFSELKPLAGYVFFYPWIAQAGEADTLRALQRADIPMLLKIDLDGSVWGIPNHTYLQKIADEAQLHFAKASNGIYRSPTLAIQCAARQ